MNYGHSELQQREKKKNKAKLNKAFQQTEAAILITSSSAMG